MRSRSMSNAMATRKYWSFLSHCPRSRATRPRPRPPLRRTMPEKPATPDHSTALAGAANPAMTTIASPTAGILTLADIDIDSARALLARHDLALICVGAKAAIPGSYWGEPEAGVIGA